MALSWLSVVTWISLLLKNSFGAIVQYPAGNGEVFDYKNFAAELHNQNIKLTVAADILSLTLLTPPGEWGADIVVGTTQRFGVSDGFWWSACSIFRY